MKYVIIGNSAAGIGAVEGIRKTDKDGEIVIISNEKYHVYSRPLISYLLLGKTTEEKMKYREDDFYVKNKCGLISGINVAYINPDMKEVVLENGKTIKYDKLLAATGSSPFVPAVGGLDGVKNKFTFMTLDDAKAIKNKINKDSQVLIMGAGLIGLKCAESVFQLVSGVTIVDLAPNILSSILDAEGSAIVRRSIESGSGKIKFKMNCGIKNFYANTAYLDNGESVDFDILVIAAGVRPNTSLLKNISDIEKGVVVNSKMETSRPDIYAAGDCTQSTDISSGENKVIALLPNAYMQGECAGINMSGGNAVFDKAIPMNAMGLFGLHMITAGSYTGNEYFENINGNYKKLFYGDNELNGYILIGTIEKAGIYTNLIRERTPLDSIDFEAIRKRPGLIAFSREYRNAKLGGLEK